MLLHFWCFPGHSTSPVISLTCGESRLYFLWFWTPRQCLYLQVAEVILQAKGWELEKLMVSWLWCGEEVTEPLNSCLASSGAVLAECRYLYETIFWSPGGVRQVTSHPGFVSCSVHQQSYKKVSLLSERAGGCDETFRRVWLPPSSRRLGQLKTPDFPNPSLLDPAIIALTYLVKT